VYYKDKTIIFIETVGNFKTTFFTLNFFILIFFVVTKKMPMKMTVSSLSDFMKPRDQFTKVATRAFGGTMQQGTGGWGLASTWALTTALPISEKIVNVHSALVTLTAQHLRKAKD
jgi:hypothetical protein